MLTTLRIHAFNPIDPVLLADLARGLRERFGIETAVGQEVSIPEGAFSRKREQFHSSRFLAALEKLNRREGAAIRLGVTSVDLYVPELNFEFGEASPEGQAAVFSIARLDPHPFGEPEDRGLLARRAMTEAVHELGHVFGLGHCERERCVMWFSNTLSETDRKGSRFCARCQRRLDLVLARAA